MMVKHLEDLINQTKSSTPLTLLTKQHTSTKLIAGDPRGACVAGKANASVGGGVTAAPRAVIRLKVGFVAEDTLSH